MCSNINRKDGKKVRSNKKSSFGFLLFGQAILVFSGVPLNRMRARARAKKKFAIPFKVMPSFAVNVIKETVGALHGVLKHR